MPSMTRSESKDFSTKRGAPLHFSGTPAFIAIMLRRGTCGQRLLLGVSGIALASAILGSTFGTVGSDNESKGAHGGFQCADLSPIRRLQLRLQRVIPLRSRAEDK